MTDEVTHFVKILTSSQIIEQVIIQFLNGIAIFIAVSSLFLRHLKLTPFSNCLQSIKLYSIFFTVFFSREYLPIFQLYYSEFFRRIYNRKFKNKLTALYSIITSSYLLACHYCNLMIHAYIVYCSASEEKGIPNRKIAIRYLLILEVKSRISITNYLNPFINTSLPAITFNRFDIARFYMKS